MIRPSRPIGKLLLTVAIAAAGSGSALASTVTLSYSTTSNGTTGTGTVTTLAVPGTDIYGNAFNGLGGTPISSANPAGFYDDYFITISGATADGVTSSVSLSDASGGPTLQVNGLQAILYNISSGSPTSSQVPLFGNGSYTAVETGTQSNVTVGAGEVVSTSVLGSIMLNPGTYALEIQGTIASGAIGGSYSGDLNLSSPVPLPATLPLLLSGLGGLAIWSRRRVSRRGFSAIV